MRGSSDAYGSWNTIWMLRRTAFIRRASSPRVACPDDADIAVPADEVRAAPCRSWICRSRIRRPAPASRPARSRTISPRPHARGRRLRCRMPPFMSKPTVRSLTSRTGGEAPGFSVARVLERAGRSCPLIAPSRGTAFEQHARIVGLRRGENRLHIARLNQPAAAHDDDAVGHLGDDAHVVGDEQHAPCRTRAAGRGSGPGSAPARSRRAPSSARRRSALSGARPAPWRSSRAAACRRRARADIA